MSAHLTLLLFIQTGICRFKNRSSGVIFIKRCKKIFKNIEGTHASDGKNVDIRIIDFIAFDGGFFLIKVVCFKVNKVQIGAVNNADNSILFEKDALSVAKRENL